MTALLTGLASLLVFSSVILVHELGHFMAARHCGIHVEEFSIGFGPCLWSTTRDGTTYSVRLLPLGGYNLFSPLPDEEDDEEDESGESAPPPAPRPRKTTLFPLVVSGQKFEDATAWQRFFVTLCGALMNFLLGMAVLLVDTVGFVSRLPHNLVEAFKSTLEEAAWSDVIVRVADAGDEQREEQLAVTDEVLDGLDCADIPRLTVYNKCDKPNTLSFDPDILLTSAKTGYGLDKLLQKLDEVLSDRVHTIRVLLPYDKLGLAAPMRERGSVQVEEYREDGLYLEGIVKTEDLHCFEGYLV